MKPFCLREPAMATDLRAIVAELTAFYDFAGKIAIRTSDHNPTIDRQRCSVGSMQVLSFFAADPFTQNGVES